MENSHSQEQSLTNSTTYVTSQEVSETPSRQAKVSSNNCGGAIQVVSEILSYNDNRLSMIIFNDTAANLFVSYTDSQGSLSIGAGVISFSEKILPGEKSQGPGIKYLGKVWGILDAPPAADKAVRITEFM